MTKLEPLWRDEVKLQSFPALKGDQDVDMVIVGGGISGITAAYLLVKEGLKVALLEADKLLNGTTGHTTAKITAQHDLIYDEFISHFGRSAARLYYEAARDAMGLIRRAIDEHGISCDYEMQDAYLYASTEQSLAKLRKELAAYEKLSIDGELVKEIPFDIQVSGALKMNKQAQFHPLKYLSRLVQAITDAGGVIYENTTAVNIKGDGGKRTVHTVNGSRVTGDYVIACSHFPFYEGTGLYSARLHADRSYALACKTKTKYPGGMYLSVDQPARSLRSALLDGEQVVLIGGESHKAGQGKDTRLHYEALETFGRDVLGVERILYRWSTQDLITLDKLPYVGTITASEPRVLIATGYRKWGMTNGTAAANLLKDLVLERRNPYQELYAPSRFYADPSLKKFLIENANVVKHLIKGKLEMPNQEVEDLSNDQGAVVTIDGERKGAYRDREGSLHVVDTTCTHVGCEVNWNAGDRTWDCPCHGSRFSYTGEVIEGPAEKPLQKFHHDMLDNFISPNSGY
ncbi:FAD-dependent oxidoreductase [Paenibacillus sp. CAU 1782]